MKIFGLEIKKAPPQVRFEVRKLDRLRLEPDDILVLHCDRPISTSSAELLESEFKKLFGNGREVLILDKGLQMTIMTKSAGPDEDSS